MISDINDSFLVQKSRRLAFIIKHKYNIDIKSPILLHWEKSDKKIKNK
jgi:hypothetical protein